jgi:hypothetical protein
MTCSNVASREAVHAKEAALQVSNTARLPSMGNAAR